MPSFLQSAAADLGLGDMLKQQTQAETDEERRKRLLEARQRSLLGPAATALGLAGSGQSSTGFASAALGGFYGSKG